jgi:hypothetical protein
MVAADSVLDTARGWTEIDRGSVPFAPRGFLPRIVVGLDETGRTRTTRVASAIAPLWSGVVNQWTLEGSDQQPHTVTATTRLAERQIAPRLPAP